MKKKTARWLGIILAMSIPVMVITAAGSAINGAALTMANRHVDGASLNLCKDDDVNCNVYHARENVWLNGSPNSDVFRTGGVFFFAVLEPVGQLDPNDRGAVRDQNLSDDFDCYQNRTFNVKNGKISSYIGNIDCSAEGYTDYTIFSHWLDNGRHISGPGNPKPNGQPPFIRLFPYAGASNPQGVYLLAVCSLEDGYPVDPRRCSYDAFRVQQDERETYAFFLNGYQVEDLYADGFDEVDLGLGGQRITISGTGPDGLPVEAEVVTDPQGYWSFSSDAYALTGNQKPQDVFLTVCETSLEGWKHSYPEGEVCHQIDFTPSGFSRILGVNFADWRPLDVTACVVQDLDGKPGGDRPAVQGWMATLTEEGGVVSSRPTGEAGCYTWSGLRPGASYDVHAEMKAGWMALGVTDWVFLSDQAASGNSLVYTFVIASLQGCTDGFWHEQDETRAVTGQALWEVMPDPDWHGAFPQPFAHSTNFCQFFGGCIGDQSMLDYLSYQDGEAAGSREEAFNRAARSLVTAFLNATWGMNYAHSTTQLHAMWSAAIETEEQLLALYNQLDEANMAFYRQDDIPTCPIYASLK